MGYHVSCVLLHADKQDCKIFQTVTNQCPITEQSAFPLLKIGRGGRRQIRVAAERSDRHCELVFISGVSQADALFCHNSLQTTAGRCQRNNAQAARRSHIMLCRCNTAHCHSSVMCRLQSAAADPRRSGGRRKLLLQRSSSGVGEGVGVKVGWGAIDG